MMQLLLYVIYIYIYRYMDFMLYIESDEALYYINNNKNDNDYKNKSEIL